jgi:ribosomal protein L37AE/L43A
VGSERLVGGVDYPRTYQEFRDGFVCPACGEDRSWQTAQPRWMCADCGRKTSVTAGTIFHRSHTPLSTWFAAVWFVIARDRRTHAQC